MEILDFQNGSKGPRKNRGRIATIVAGAFLVAMVGSTFAANITINSTGTLEYAQGITQATACDSSLNITPTNRFVNAAGGGVFKLETITVTDSTTATAAGIGLGNCAGKTLRIAAYNNATGPLTLSAGTTPTYCDVAIATYSSSLVQASVDSAKCVATITKKQNGFDLAFTSPSLLASDIYKITLESF
jgi:hypothetical protein